MSTRTFYVGILIALFSQTFGAQELSLPEFVATITQKLDNGQLAGSSSLAPRSSVSEDTSFQLEPHLAQTLGSLVGVTTLPDNRVALFHRGPVVWSPGFFDGAVFPMKHRKNGPIKMDTIVIIDATTGQYITSFGGHTFYVPHGISADAHGNLWVTDVALHQVFRYPHQVIASAKTVSNVNHSLTQLADVLVSNANAHVQPDLVLGEAFVPGNDDRHFCKPTDVAIAASGLAFIADGYCNQRILIVTPNGQMLDSFGTAERMLTPHSLSLLEKDDLVCVADRDRSRILCYNAAMSGTDMSSEISSKRQLMFAIDYPLGRVFAIEHVGDHMLVLSVNDDTKTAHGATVDLANGRIVQDWSPKEWRSGKQKMPHDLAVTRATPGKQRSAFVVEATAYNQMKNNWLANAEKNLFKYKIQT
ncbi:Peptidyl-alpha-hydroxyglycine alpha-amidating lyase 2 [Fragariocoptes setiger]|uniref:peptidylamidoglycolate lyase n=1 Tax=Fragariocoptes setiger TaxID=1670756 RepID=A0ABQ7S5B4_9ACAR|nr:Peptidyl-alpha-hydroxyglycine alpha-amidating lyase 2 [Fragariocoptes setiger]